eukprot:COSAG02_NODE_3131_length_7311_cov_11.071131_5_plen_90_part_00
MSTRPRSRLRPASDIAFGNCLCNGDNAVVGAVRPAASIAASLRSSTSVIACQVLSCSKGTNSANTYHLTQVQPIQTLARAGIFETHTAI